MDLVLRPARPADVSKVVCLVNSVYRGEEAKKSWTTEAELLEGLRIDEPTLTQLLQTSGHHVLVLERQSDAKILGCVELTQTSSDVFHLGMLSILADEQQAGLGSKLLAQAENYARGELGASTIEMSVVSVREELLNWYYRRGYGLTERKVPFAGEALRLSSFKKEALTFLILKKSLNPL